MSADVSEVVPGTWECMRAREATYRPEPTYLSRHPVLTPVVRAILLDWMMEVCQEFLLKRETFYLAQNYVDRYLSLVRAQVLSEAHTPSRLARAHASLPAACATAARAW